MLPFVIEERQEQPISKTCSAEEPESKGLMASACRQEDEWRVLAEKDADQTNGRRYPRASKALRAAKEVDLVGKARLLASSVTSAASGGAAERSVSYDLTSQT